MSTAPFRGRVAPWALLLLALVVPVGTTSSQQAGHQPKTAFVPSRDLLQIANPRGRVLSSGSCGGLTELAIAYYQDGQSANQNSRVALANLGQQVSTIHQGEPLYLERIAETVQSIYAKDFQPVNWLTGSIVPAQVNRALESGVPIMLDLRYGNGGAHDVVVYDSEIFGNRIRYHIGDPNYPANNNIILEYDQANKRWLPSKDYQDLRFVSIDSDGSRIRPLPATHQALFRVLASTAVRPEVSSRQLRERMGFTVDGTRIPPSPTFNPAQPPQGANTGPFSKAAAVDRALAPAGTSRSERLSRVQTTSPLKGGFGGVILGNEPMHSPRVRQAAFLVADDQVSIEAEVEGQDGKFTYDDLTMTDLWAAYHFLHPNEEVKALGAEPGDLGLVGIANNNRADGSWDFAIHPALSNTRLAYHMMRLDMVLSLGDPRLPAVPGGWKTYRWYDAASTIAVKDGKIGVQTTSGQPLMRLQLWGADKEMPFDTAPFIADLYAQFDSLRYIDRFARTVAVLNWLDAAGRLPSLPQQVQPEKFNVPNKYNLADVIYDGVTLIRDRLTAQDAKDRDFKDSFRNVQLAPLEEGKTYVIDLKSAAFDAFLRIEDDAGNILASDDDSLDGRNCRIVFKPKASDCYRLVTTSYDSAKTGPFTLALWAGQPGPGQRVFERISKLTDQDPRDPVRRASPNKAYLVNLERGLAYTIHLRSKEFDAYLRLEDAQKTPLASDDDSGGDRNSKLQFTPEKSGPYRLIATAFSGGQGTFALTVERTGLSGWLTAAPSQSAAPAVIVNVTQALTPQDDKDKVRQNSFCRIYPVELRAGVTYTVDLASKEFDTYLRLEDSSGRQLAENDDGGEGLNARLLVTPATTQTYRIIATSYATATGRFTLTVKEGKQP